MKRLNSVSVFLLATFWAVVLSMTAFGFVPSAWAANADHVKKLLSDRTCIGCDLQGANLKGADLRGVNLAGANLSRANLQGAELLAVNLKGANLQRANLKEADLMVVNLEDANLKGAQIESATIRSPRYCHTITPTGETKNTDCQKS